MDSRSTMVSSTTRPLQRTGAPPFAAGLRLLRMIGVALALAWTATTLADDSQGADDWFGQPFSGSADLSAQEPMLEPYPAPDGSRSPYEGHSFLPAPAAAPPVDEPVSSWQPAPSPGLSLLPDASGGAEVWDYEILPEGLLYKSYLAGEKEPRISSAWLTEQDRGLVWETALGGREGIWRCGDPSAPWPIAAQLDVEGAALVRLDPEANTDVEAVDFRFGVLMTWRNGPWASKAGYYHISSHLGDEYMIRNPTVPRYNYVRDAAITGISYDANPDVRLYGEVSYAIGHQGGALPLELQVGAEYAPARPAEFWGSPYAAVNSHLREDNGWINGVNVMTGWMWRGTTSDHTMRVGLQYYSGPALQWSFVGKNETLVGGGLWFDY